ncbi:hypothetical protein EXIGLDRAFT_730424 [Exidia glandulosa HHB12029]|uniref:Uncharacterized protein n=1 Tax=Exidia glandulosa HHB12029 TaxID=1314781 RepID=A0A165C5W7_EXIGL|nr:hypothetical protein EXIGLDRAFT_730424 [Exidia glandulosa HHB12029]
MRLPPELILPVAEALMRDPDTKTLARLALVSSSYRALVTPYLYHTVFLHRPKAALAFCNTLSLGPELGVYVHLLSVRPFGAVRLAQAPVDLLGVCMNLATIQALHMDTHNLGSIVPSICASPATRLAIGEVGEPPVDALSRVTGHDGLAPRLTELYILCSSISETPAQGPITSPPKYTSLERLERLVIAIDLGLVHNVSNRATTLDGRLCEVLLPALESLKDLPRLERLRLFFYPTRSARVVLGVVSDFVASVRELEDPRITMAAIAAAFDAESLLVRHEHGNIDMWAYGETLLESYGTCS